MLCALAGLAGTRPFEALGNRAEDRMQQKRQRTVTDEVICARKP